MNKKCLHILFCLLLLLAGGKAYSDQSGSWKTAAVIDAQDPVEAAKWGEFGNAILLDLCFRELVGKKQRCQTLPVWMPELPPPVTPASMPP